MHSWQRVEPSADDEGLERVYSDAQTGWIEKKERYACVRRSTSLMQQASASSEQSTALCGSSARQLLPPLPSTPDLCDNAAFGIQRHNSGAFGNVVSGAHSFCL